jgi:uncharacterized membrane protein
MQTSIAYNENLVKYGLDLADLDNVPVGFAIVVVTMIVMAALLFWVFKQKQWIMSNNDDNSDKMKQKNKHND